VSVQGKLDITIKISQMPNAEQVENSWKKFSVDCDGRVITMKVRPKVFKKLEEAQASYPEWVAAITARALASSPWVALTVAAALCASCDRMASEHREAAQGWYDEIERHAWRCDVMGDRMGRKRFTRNARLLADGALRHTGPDRADYLAGLRVEPPPAAAEALRRCHAEPTVKAAQAAWLAAISPLLLIEDAATAPLPDLPPPDANSATP
jgi:hypothetical protein